MPKIYRADHVGSLLRPQEVLDAHAAFGENKLSTEQLTEIENGAVLKALDLQREVGLEVFSDGEYRRASWAGDFNTSVDGYVMATVPIPFEWKLPEALAAAGRSGVQQMQTVMPQQSGMVIGARVRQHKRLTAHEVPFLKQHAPGPFK